MKDNLEIKFSFKEDYERQRVESSITTSVNYKEDREVRDLVSLMNRFIKRRQKNFTYVNEKFEICTINNAKKDLIVFDPQLGFGRLFDPVPSLEAPITAQYSKEFKNGISYQLVTYYPDGKRKYGDKKPSLFIVKDNEVPVVATRKNVEVGTKVFTTYFDDGEVKGFYDDVMYITHHNKTVTCVYLEDGKYRSNDSMPTLFIKEPYTKKPRYTEEYYPATIDVLKVGSIVYDDSIRSFGIVYQLRPELLWAINVNFPTLGVSRSYKRTSEYSDEKGEFLKMSPEDSNFTNGRRLKVGSRVYDPSRNDEGKILEINPEEIVIQFDKNCNRSFYSTWNALSASKLGLIEDEKIDITNPPEINLLNYQMFELATSKNTSKVGDLVFSRHPNVTGEVVSTEINSSVPKITVEFGNNKVDYPLHNVYWSRESSCLLKLIEDYEPLIMESVIPGLRVSDLKGNQGTIISTKHNIEVMFDGGKISTYSPSTKYQIPTLVTRKNAKILEFANIENILTRDQVWHPQLGYGVVDQINRKSNEPLHVMFDKNYYFEGYPKYLFKDSPDSYSVIPAIWGSVKLDDKVWSADFGYGKIVNLNAGIEVVFDGTKKLVWYTMSGQKKLDLFPTLFKLDKDHRSSYNYHFATWRNSKTGDKVWSSRYGYGVIEEIHPVYKSIQLKFDFYSGDHYYGIDGKRYCDDPVPTLILLK